MGTIITLPSSVRIRHIEWEFDQPAQVNRGAYSGSRQAVSNPWHGIRRGTVQLAPLIGEAAVRPWRGFLASLLGQANTFLLPATEGTQITFPTVYAAIANHANTTVSGPVSNAYTVTKSGGSAAAYDAGAVSTTGFIGDFVIRVKHLTNGVTPNAYFAGANSDPLTDDNYTSIDYAWVRLESAAGWQIYESGAAFATFADSPYAWIWRVGATLYYGRGATLAAAQASPDRIVTGVTATLYFDSALYSTNDSFEVLFSGAQTPMTAAAPAAQGATSLTLNPSLGADIIAADGLNGSFPTNVTGWTNYGPGTFSWISNGDARVVATGGNTTVQLPNIAGLTAGQPYRLSVKVTALSPGGSQWQIDAGDHTLGGVLNDGFSNSFATGTATLDFAPTFGANESIAVMAVSGVTLDIKSVTLQPHTTPALKAGMLATVTLPSGNQQMVILTQDMGSDRVINFRPALREAISAGASVEVANPCCQVALAQSSYRYGVDPGGPIYNIGFDVEEAF